MKKLLTLLYACSLSSLIATAQDGTYLWTAGNLVSSTYNVDNYYNQYQDPWPYDRYTLVPLIAPPQGWKQIISVGGYYTAIDGDGHLWNWATNMDMARAPIVGQSTDENTYRQIAYGGNSSTFYAILEDGTMLRNGEVVEIDPGDRWVKMSNSSTILFALRTDGTLWRWNNSTASGLSAPTQVGVGATWTDLATTADTRYGLRDDGTIWAVYDGDMMPYWQQGTDADWAKIYASISNLYAIKDNGTLWAKGLVNTNGALGTGSTSGASTLTQVGEDTDWERVFPGNNHCFGLKTDSTLFGWGKNDMYQLGDGTNSLRLSPVQIGEPGEWTLACPGSAHSCFARTWGYSGDVSTGVSPLASPEFTLYPVPAHSYLTVSDLQAGSFVTIIDPAGRQVRSERTDRPVLTMHLQGLADGVYVLRVETLHGQVSTRQFVVKK